MKARLLLSLLFALGVSRLLAYDFEDVNADGVTLFYNILSSSECEVARSGVNYELHLNIPSTATFKGKELKVISIGDYSFNKSSQLISVNIPNSVTSIGEGAFFGCTGLTSINIPYNVTSIGNYAFRGCTGLTSIVIPYSVTKIGGGLFRGCTGLTSIIVEEGNNFYDSRNDCNAIVTSISNGDVEPNTLISGCNTTIIPNNVTSIGDYAFAGCTGLTSINIPNSVTSIGISAFGGCSALTSINIPNSVTSIGNYAFSGCTGLTSINIPNSVTSIDWGTFHICM